LQSIIYIYIHLRLKIYTFTLKIYMASQRIIAVTGANKGIGLDTVRLLAAKEPAAIIVLASRDEGRGKNAVDQLHGEGWKNVQFLQLDITNEESVDYFVKGLQSFGGCNLLINNAGFAYKNAATEPFTQQAKDSVDINYYGTRRVCLKVRAQFPKCRITNVASMTGPRACSQISAENRKAMFETNDKIYPIMTDSNVNQFVDHFVETSGQEKSGYGKSAYGFSKLGVIMMTEVLGREGEMNCVCPGWCKSDMAGWEKPPLTTKDGAERVVDAAYKTPFEAGAYYSEKKRACRYPCPNREW